MCLAPFCHFPSLPAMVHLDYDAKWRLSRTAYICTFSMRYMAYENFQNVTTVSSFSWTFQNTQKFSRATNSRGERIMYASFVFPETAWKTSWTPVHDNETPRWGAKSDFPCYFLMWDQYVSASFSTTIDRTTKFLGVLKSSREAAYCRDVLEILTCHIPHAKCTDVCATWKSSFCVIVEVNHGR